MPKFNPIKTSVSDARAFENMKADIERNKAINDYIAMMCDIELPDHSDEKEDILDER